MTHDDIKSGRTMAKVSNVSFAVAGVGAAIAVVGIVLGGSNKASVEAAASLRMPSRPTVTPWVSTDSAGLAGTF